MPPTALPPGAMCAFIVMPSLGAVGTATGTGAAPVAVVFVWSRELDLVCPWGCTILSTMALMPCFLFSTGGCYFDEPSEFIGNEKHQNEPRFGAESRERWLPAVEARSQVWDLRAPGGRVSLRRNEDAPARTLSVGSAGWPAAAAWPTWPTWVG